MIGAIRSLTRLLSGSHRLVAFSVAIATAQIIVLVPIALLVRDVFDDLIPGGERAGLIATGAAILGLYLVASGLGLWTRAVSLRVTKDAVTALRIQLLEKVYALPRSFFDRQETSRLHGTIVQDSERIDQMANALVAYLLPATVVAAGLSLAMLILNPALFALLLVVAPGLFFGSVAIGRAVRRRTATWRDSFETFDSQTLFALRSVTLTKAHGVDSSEIAARRRQLDELGSLGRAMAFMQSAYSLANGTVMAIGAVIVLVVGGYAVTAGTMTTGDLVSFFTLLALLRGQTPAMLTAIPTVISGMESLQRVEALLDAEAAEPYRGVRKIQFDGAVQVEEVCFSYAGGEEVLTDFSLELGSGETVAVIGPNGAGKSTLVSLILGLYRPDSGRLCASGVPFDEIDLRHLRSRIGTVFQSPILFSATVRENIAYATPEASEEELRRAAASGAGGRVRRAPSTRLRDPDRRRGHPSFRRTAAAGRDRASSAAQTRPADPRRADHSPGLGVSGEPYGRPANDRPFPDASHCHPRFADRGGGGSRRRAARRAPGWGGGAALTGMGYLPGPRHAALLHAALDEGDAASAAWRRWREAVEFDEIDEVEHRLLPLAWRNLGERLEGDPVAGRVRGLYRMTWTRNQLLFAGAADAVRALDAEGISFLLLKGAPLCLLHYRDIGVRPMADVDVLVHPAQAEAAMECLLSGGWRGRVGNPARMIPVHHSYEVAKPPHSRVDLHWFSLWASSGDSPLWEAAVPVSIGDETALAPCPADALLNVCAHGSPRQPIPAFRWIADAVAIVRSSSPDWERLVAEAGRRRLTVTAAGALSYLREEFALEVPDEALASLAVSPAPRWERAGFRAATRPRTPWGTLTLLWERHRRMRALAHEAPWHPGFFAFAASIWGFDRRRQLIAHGFRRSMIFGFNRCRAALRSLVAGRDVGQLGP